MNPFTAFIPESLEERLQDGVRHALSLGAEGAETFISVSRSRKAKVQNGHLEDLTVSKRGGLGVRVIRGGAKGFRTGLADPELVYWTHSGHLVFMTVLGGFSHFLGATIICVEMCTVFEIEIYSVTPFRQAVKHQ